MNAPLVETPNYVLISNKLPTGPILLSHPSGPEYVAIFAFSDKPPYDLFCRNSPLGLTPYPLVKGYLRNQIALPGDTVRLIVVDAAGPDQLQVNAVTMQAVLEAHEESNKQVVVSHRLLLDGESKAYRVENVLELT